MTQIESGRGYTLDELLKMGAKPVVQPNTTGSSFSEIINQHNAAQDSTALKVAKTAASITGGDKIAAGLGEAIAQPQNSKLSTQALNDQIDTQGKLIKLIKQKKALGQDTKRLESALSDLDNEISNLGANTEKILNPENITQKEVVGDALQLATTAGGGTLAAKLGTKAAAAKGVLNGALQGAKAGAASGALIGAGTDVSQGLKNNGNVSDILPNAAEGAIGGALSGGALGALGGALTGKINKVIDNRKNFVQNLVTPELSNKDMAEAIKTGKVVEDVTVGGKRDFTAAIPNLDEITKSVKQVQGVSRKNTLLQNANAIHSEIGNVAEDLKTQLKDKGFFSPQEFNGYMSKIKSELADNPVLVGDSEKTATKIINKFNSLVKEKGYTPEGVLEARKALDSWVSIQKGSSAFDPAKENALSIALRAVRQGGNNFIAEKVPDVAVKDLLKHQSNLYQAIENISEKASKEGGNAVSRFFNQNPKVKILLGALATTGIGYVGGSAIANAANAVSK